MVAAFPGRATRPVWWSRTTIHGTRPWHCRYANTGHGAGRRTRTPDPLSTNQPLYQLSYASLCGSPLDFHIPDCSLTKATPLHSYMARAGKPHATRPRSSFQERIVILCGVNRNAHISLARPNLSCQWWDSNPRPRAFNSYIPSRCKALPTELHWHKKCGASGISTGRTKVEKEGFKRPFAVRHRTIALLGKGVSMNSRQGDWQGNQ